MRKVVLTPGKFSNHTTKPMQLLTPIPATPDKQSMLEKQRKSVERLSMNPKTTRREYLEWEMREQEYKDEIAKLKAEKRRLEEQIESIEKEESNHKILEYEMYIVELNNQIKEQKSTFALKYKELEEQLSNIVNEEESYSHAVANCERYRNSLHDLILSVTAAYSCLNKLTKNKSISEMIDKQFSIIYTILDPYVKDFGVSVEIEQAILEERENGEHTEHRQHESIDLDVVLERETEQQTSVMTFPPNSVFKETFNKEMFSNEVFSKNLFETEVSTCKSNRSRGSFDSHFMEGNTYEVRKRYSSGCEGHLELREGGQVTLLKRSSKGMWIGESGENIGYFPQYILL